MRHRFVAYFSSSRAACFTLCCEMLAGMAHSYHSVLASSGACASFSRVAEPGFSGLSVAFWFWGGGGVNHVRRVSFSHGIPVLSKVFSRQKYLQTWQRFQTCRPTENLSFCAGEGSPNHTRGQRHHLVILKEDCSKNDLNHTYKGPLHGTHHDKQVCFPACSSALATQQDPAKPERISVPKT